MTIAAILLAAGQGVRAGGGVPKQWRTLAGRRVVEWALTRFTRSDIDLIVLVANNPDPELRRELSRENLILTEGGADRAESVRNGLGALTSYDATRVLIHDAARPCVSARIITDVLAALETHEAAAPGLAVTDALWASADGCVTETRDRSGVFAAQTPQGFHYDRIVAAHAAHRGTAADDVEVARAAGVEVAIVPGDPDNLKITSPEDFERAEQILKGPMDIRIGNGFDVHRFGDGSQVVLCGVEIPHDRGLQGHSDADVGLHAITDAIYGALAQGDIGRHFPPSEPKWRGAASDIFLRHAVDLATEMGFAISNIDCTLICEEPKIGPHAAAMQERLCSITGVAQNRISVKATTTERLGFTGRKEGIAAIATATLVTT